MKNFVIFWLCLLALPAVAQRDGVHDFLVTDDKARAWLSVGRVDVARQGYCTGSLISERVVLTAAHCVINKTTGARYDAKEVVFRAGYRRGRSVADIRARRFVIHEKYDHKSPVSETSIPTDIALIELEKPVSDLRLRPFLLRRKPSVDDKVMVVSYARGRSEIPALEDGCRMTGIYGRALSYDCDTDFGSSGAPVFVMTDQGPKIASMMTSGSKTGGRKVAYGASLDGTLDRLLNRLAASDPRSKFVGASEGGVSARKSLSEQLGRTSSSRRLPQIGK